MFEYDVFLSFSSKDEHIARPIWQELSGSGIRVFWSDESLKKNTGQSFFKVIEEALTKSQHFILICSNNAIASKWVSLEYETFFSNFHIKDEELRRLVISPVSDFDMSKLPPFLSNLQVTSSIKSLIPLVGGVDIKELLLEKEEIKSKLNEAWTEISKLHSTSKELTQYKLKNYELRDEVKILTREKQSNLISINHYETDIHKLRSENVNFLELNKVTSKKIKDKTKKIQSQKKVIDNNNINYDKLSLINNSLIKDIEINDNIINKLNKENKKFNSVLFKYRNKNKSTLHIFNLSISKLYVLSLIFFFYILLTAYLLFQSYGSTGKYDKTVKESNDPAIARPVYSASVEKVAEQHSKELSDTDIASLQDLIEKRDKLRARYYEMLQIYKPVFPEMVELKKKISLIQKEIDNKK